MGEVISVDVPSMKKELKKVIDNISTNDFVDVKYGFEKESDENSFDKYICIHITKQGGK